MGCRTFNKQHSIWRSWTGVFSSKKENLAIFRSYPGRPPNILSAHHRILGGIDGSLGIFLMVFPQCFFWRWAIFRCRKKLNGTLLIVRLREHRILILNQTIKTCVKHGLRLERERIQNGQWMYMIRFINYHPSFLKGFHPFDFVA